MQCQAKGINFNKVANEGASFVNKKGRLEKKVSAGFNVHATITLQV